MDDIDDFECDDFEKTLKVIVVGNGNVGKTSMTTRYAKGRYTGNYKKTIGVDFMEKRLELRDFGETINLMIWDTAGQEEFGALTSRYYKGAGAVIYVFSTTDRDSFDDLPKWQRKVEEECGRISQVLVQNKIDLADDAAMSRREVEDMADYMDIKLFRSCVQDNVNVKEVFEHLCRQYLKHGGRGNGGAAGRHDAVADISTLSEAAAAAALKGSQPSPSYEKKARNVRDVSDISDTGSASSDNGKRPLSSSSSPVASVSSGRSRGRDGGDRREKKWRDGGDDGDGGRGGRGGGRDGGEGRGDGSSRLQRAKSEKQRSPKRWNDDDDEEQDGGGGGRRGRGRGSDDEEVEDDDDRDRGPSRRDGSRRVDEREQGWTKSTSSRHGDRDRPQAERNGGRGRDRERDRAEERGDRDRARGKDPSQWDSRRDRARDQSDDRDRGKDRGRDEASDRRRGRDSDRGRDERGRDQGRDYERESSRSSDQDARKPKEREREKVRDSTRGKSTTTATRGDDVNVRSSGSEDRGETRGGSSPKQNEATAVAQKEHSKHSSDDISDHEPTIEDQDSRRDRIAAKNSPGRLSGSEQTALGPKKDKAVSSASSGHEAAATLPAPAVAAAADPPKPMDRASLRAQLREGDDDSEVSDAVDTSDHHANGLRRGETERASEKIGGGGKTSTNLSESSRGMQPSKRRTNGKKTNPLLHKMTKLVYG